LVYSKGGEKTLTNCINSKVSFLAFLIEALVLINKGMIAEGFLVGSIIEGFFGNDNFHDFQSIDRLYFSS